MARRSLVLIAPFLTLPSLAVTAAPPDPALIDALAAAKPSSISGTVTDESTGVGVAGVDVWLLDPFGIRSAKTVTRADGRYVLRPPPGGTYFHVLAPDSFELGLGPALYDGLQCLLGCELVTGTPVEGRGHATGVDLVTAWPWPPGPSAFADGG
jgi:hypothetical protein